MRFIIKGKIQPYTRMTQRGKYVVPKAQAYLSSQAEVRAQLMLQTIGCERPVFERGTPLRFHAQIKGYGHNCDVSNLLKALGDAAQGILFPNDCWVDDLQGVRSDFKAEPEIILSVTTLTVEVIT